MTDEQLRTLLRLKRFEQPSAGYFDRLLQDVHRRQRSELLRRPLWQIALERARTFFGEPSLGQMSYASAMAAVVVVAGLGFANSGGGKTLADLQPATPLAQVIEAARVDGTSAPVNLLTLENSPVPTRVALEDAPFRAPQSRAAFARQPRYVIDARPASYEATTVSFNF